MEKKKALGGDPLSWLKEKKSEEKETFNKSDQPGKIKIPITPQDKEEEVAESGYKANLDQPYETQGTTQKRRTVVIGDHEPAYETKFRPPKPKENPATIFVVVYTVLLLILGFLVFRDLTKKINKLEAKLSKIEKMIDSDYTRYNDSDF